MATSLCKVGSSAPKGTLIYPWVHGRQFHIQVLSDAILLERVPIEVTRVSSQVTQLVFFVFFVPQPQV